VRPGVDAPADEYDSYAPTILAMVTAGASAGELAEHLGKLSAVTMGLWARPARDLEIASAIVATLESPPASSPPSLHDASLLSVRLDWITGEVVLHFRVSAADALVVVTEAVELVIPRREDWGRSASALTTRFVDDNPDSGLIVEMQSGDVLVVRGKVCSVPS
jgi:hypothetical protein